MSLEDCQTDLQNLDRHAWDLEVPWLKIESWLANFTGEIAAVDEERRHAAYALTKYLYFSRQLTKQMLKSLYRDHFEAPLVQRLRRNMGNTRDFALLKTAFLHERNATRFIGVGNPSESGAHLLYYFRQVNRLPKDLFADVHGLFYASRQPSGQLEYIPKSPTVSHYVFFDDLIGSGDQASIYLGAVIRSLQKQGADVRYLALFGTKNGLAKLNSSSLFNGKASALFELDESYRAFDVNSRHFKKTPPWFDLQLFRAIAEHYGGKLWPNFPLGYKDGQLLLSFAHNTPDNALPIFWDEGMVEPWVPVFLRYHKI
jgi:hypothetical protein